MYTVHSQYTRSNFSPGISTAPPFTMLMCRCISKSEGSWTHQQLSSIINIRALLLDLMQIVCDHKLKWVSWIHEIHSQTSQRSGERAEWVNMFICKVRHFYIGGPWRSICFWSLCFTFPPCKLFIWVINFNPLPEARELCCSEDSPPLKTEISYSCSLGVGPPLSFSSTSSFSTDSHVLSSWCYYHSVVEWCLPVCWSVPQDLGLVILNHLWSIWLGSIQLVFGITGSTSNLVMAFCSMPCLPASVTLLLCAGLSQGPLCTRGP